MTEGGSGCTGSVWRGDGGFWLVPLQIFFAKGGIPPLDRVLYRFLPGLGLD